jgi:hypothetical protein
LFFEKIDKPLAKFTKRRREKTQSNKIRDEKENNITNTNGFQRIIREYYKHLYSNKVDLEEMDKFLNSFDLSKLNQEDVNHLTISIMSNEIEALIVS